METVYCDNYCIAEKSVWTRTCNDMMKSVYNLINIRHVHSLSLIIYLYMESKRYREYHKKSFISIKKCQWSAASL